MKNRFIPLALLLALAAPASLLAQEEESYEPGQLYQVTTWRVDPADATAWEGAVMQIVEAAEVSNIGPAHRWAFWQDGTKYTLVFPMANFASLDDPQEFMRAFADTEGEAMMKEAMDKFQGFRADTEADEIVEIKSDWSYEVEGFDMGAIEYAHLDELWTRPGMSDEFEQLNEDFVALFKDIEYPYPYDAHTVRIGQSRTIYVTFIDDLAAYYGENDLMKLIEAKNQSERWEEIMAQFNNTVDRFEHYNIAYRSDMSYWPEPPQQQAAKN